MFWALARLFATRDRLSLLSRRGDPSAFIRALGDWEVTLLLALTSEGLDASTFTPEDLLAEIKKAAEDLSDRADFTPFVYQRDGVQILPFFSTTDRAQVFCGNYSKQRNRVFPFQTINVSGSALASIPMDASTLVLNAGSADEYVFSEADMTLLTDIWGRDAPEDDNLARENGEENDCQ